MGPDTLAAAQSIATKYSLFYNTSLIFSTLGGFVVAFAFFRLYSIGARIALVAIALAFWGFFVGLTWDRFIVEDISALKAEGLAALSQEPCTPIGQTPHSRFKAERLLCEGGQAFKVLTKVGIPDGPMVATFFKHSRTLVEASPVAAPAGK